MRVITNAKTLTSLYKDYRTMDEDDRIDFYQNKCDYYQNYVGISLIAGVLLSITYIVSDYLITGDWTRTLLPRLSVLIALAIFFLVTHFYHSRAITVFMDFFVAHAIVISTLWATYQIGSNNHVKECLMIMNVAFLAVGFVSKTRETILSYIIFFLEILLSKPIINYSDTRILFAMQIPVTIAVITSHALLMLFYLDHYRMRQKLELAMVTDPLTQVYNRHLLEKIVTQNALRDVNGPVAVAMMDIDYFKQVNDEHGHYTGDLTLLYIGQKLAKGTHDDDYVIRYGGEEFIIILKNCDVNNACARMEQFRRDIESATDTPVPITVSVGVSRYTGDFSKTIQNVDMALYKAKNAGRNMVVVV